MFPKSCRRCRYYYQASPAEPGLCNAFHLPGPTRAFQCPDYCFDLSKILQTLANILEILTFLIFVLLVFVVHLLPLIKDIPGVRLYVIVLTSSFGLSIAFYIVLRVLLSKLA